MNHMLFLPPGTHEPVDAAILLLPVAVFLVLLLGGGIYLELRRRVAAWRGQRRKPKVIRAARARVILNGKEVEHFKKIEFKPADVLGKLDIDVIYPVPDLPPPKFWCSCLIPNALSIKTHGELREWIEETATEAFREGHVPRICKVGARELQLFDDGFQTRIYGEAGTKLRECWTGVGRVEIVPVPAESHLSMES